MTADAAARIQSAAARASDGAVQKGSFAAKAQVIYGSWIPTGHVVVYGLESVLWSAELRWGHS